MWRWLGRLDTFFIRLFLLMWVALVGSHILAFMAATARDDMADRHLPVMPSLPPMDMPLFNGLPGLDHGARNTQGPRGSFSRGDSSEGGPFAMQRGRPGPADGSAGGSAEPYGLEGAGEAPPFQERRGPPGRPFGSSPRAVDDFPDGEGFHGAEGREGNDRLGPFGPSGPPGRFGPNGPMLWLDYLVRILVIGLFAAAGAYWLAAPIRRLSKASQTLGDALTSGAPAVLLDEERGTAEVRQASRVFNEMARRLREQFQGRSLFMAAISHDLRTPLTRLRMRLETMSPQAQAHACVADVHEMDALISSVLDLVRGQHGSSEQRRVDVSSLVASVADDFVDMGASGVVVGAEQSFDSLGDPIRDLTIATVSAGEEFGSMVPRPATSSPVLPSGPAKVPATVKTHLPSLRRVLENLVGNAVRYGKHASLDVCVVEGRVRLTIDDRGPGIAEDQLEAVFQPFYRLDASRSRHTGGAGLGLYIARDLIQRDGGDLVLSNRPEGGLRATVTLPLG
ncbi:MAG: Histidine kinase [Rhizobacter sp.]|nr:Histidine kinase [Rhizobacter sp.]